jgi:hypothetical protein
LTEFRDDSLSAEDLDRVRGHLAGCAKCRKFYEDEKRLAGLIQDSLSLWAFHYRGVAPSVTSGHDPLSESRSKKIPRRYFRFPPRWAPDIRAARFHYRLWRTAFGAALIILGISGFFLFRRPADKAVGFEASKRLELRETDPRVQVISVELKGKPAKPYIFQTPKASFIWIGPSKDIGG